MRKISLFLGILISTFSVFGYSTTDISNAVFLAEQGIITTQSSTKGYRLDDNITRAEAVGIALKVKGVTLPEKYTCMNYFTDVRYNSTNNWICRAAELAADNWLVTRENAKFRPQDNITKAEALAILVGQFDPQLGDFPYSFDTTISWQRFLLWFAAEKGIIDITQLKKTIGAPGMGNIIYHFSPDRSATRAEVFSFARNILEKNGATNNSVYENIFSADFGNDFSQSADENITYFSFGEKVQALEAPIGTLEHRYLLSIFDNPRFSHAMGDKFERMGTYKGKTYYVFNYGGMCEGRFLIFFAGNQIIQVSSACQWEINALLDGLEKINFDITSGYRLLNHNDILTIYYQLIDDLNVSTAYNMRSPVGVSEETFMGWYKNVTDVTFREDTLKDLGDNTYEFLVDMTENGIKSTYKVKSKVDLEKFKINNISSVKQ